MTSTILERLAPWRTRVDAALTLALPLRDLDGTAAPKRLLDAMSHGVLGGGKRLRPLLVVATARSLSTSDSDDALFVRAMPSALAVELVHSYSLIHDDLPALDDDAERRGRPTVHVAFDEATAVLAGDALLTDAFALLSTSPTNPARQVRELALAVGSAGMVGGQYDDITVKAESVDALDAIHRRKTGRLFAASSAIGALCVGARDGVVNTMREYGARLGLAFQIRDDVLDQQGYATLLGADEAQQRAVREADKAAALASSLSSELLVELARFSASRSV